jgi:hypothetical protein
VEKIRKKKVLEERENLYYIPPGIFWQRKQAYKQAAVLFGLS